jgi:hypothetical protein
MSTNNYLTIAQLEKALKNPSEDEGPDKINRGTITGPQIENLRDGLERIKDSKGSPDHANTFRLKCLEKTKNAGPNLMKIHDCLTTLSENLGYYRITCSDPVNCGKLRKKINDSDDVSFVLQSKTDGNKEIMFVQTDCESCINLITQNKNMETYNYKYEYLPYDVCNALTCISKYNKPGTLMYYEPDTTQYYYVDPYNFEIPNTNIWNMHEIIGERRINGIHPMEVLMGYQSIY